LELELERLKRDVSRNEHELVSSKRDLEEKTAALREEELRVMTLVSDGAFETPFSVVDHLSCIEQESEIKDLSQQLASQTQTRLALTDKYDEASKDQREWRSRLQAKQAEVDSGKVGDVERSLYAELIFSSVAYRHSSLNCRAKLPPYARLKALPGLPPKSLISQPEHPELSGISLQPRRSSLTLN
jgi:hypothetical protein